MSKQQITISGVRQDLKDGLTREQIGEKYGLNKSQVKLMFKHPQLKFRKTLKPKELPFDLIDDLTPQEDTQLNLIDAINESQAEAEVEAKAEESVEESVEQVVEEKSTWS